MTVLKRAISALFTALTLVHCRPAQTDDTPDFSPVSRVDSGRPVAVMLTAYSTTLRADGKNWTPLRIALTDSASREIRSAGDSIRLYLTGEGRITTAMGGSLAAINDTGDTRYVPLKLVNGVIRVGFRTGASPGKVKLEARSDSLFPGAHEIHTIPGDTRMERPTPEQLPPTTKPIPRMIGADISFLPEIENGAGRFAERPRGFFEGGQKVDAVALLQRHGFNFIRLRIFVNPENPRGYSPGVGFCGLDSTLSMARRVKAAGMGLLLDFHYSDYWADPQQQNKPLAWENLQYPALRDSVRSYTTSVLQALNRQGTLPDMVQIGNEINHGLLWPEGHISNLDQLAGLLQAGVEGTEAVDPKIPVMMHIALGGQNDESRFWLDNMLARGVKFDILGLSYYPRWHGTLEDLSRNLHDLIQRYHKPVNVVEYSDFKRPVHDIVFGLPGDMGKGAAIWEPLGWRSGLFDREGNVTELMTTYDSLRARYLR
jgi:beta-galactosidase